MASISLLITYYNEKELLTECLLSVYEQTILPDEILIYDDASRFPATEYIPYHPFINVKVIRGKNNIMLAAARNELMKLASCDFLHYQDADDLLEPHCIETLKSKVQNNSSELIINEVRSISLETEKCLSNAVMSLYKLKDESDLIEFAISGALLAPSTTFTKTLGLKLGGYKAGTLLQCEDFEFNIRLAFYAKNIQIIKDPLIIQRVRKNSMSSNTKELYIEGIKALKLLLTELPTIYHKTIAERASSMGRILFQNGNYSEAREAFNFAKQINSKPYKNENLFYRTLSSFLGQYNTEQLSFFYRKVLPKRIRQKLTV